MAKKLEKRGAARTDHNSPLRIRDLRSGVIHEARMVNYSDSGICFGTNGVLEKGTRIYICMQNSPYSLASGVLEYYNGEVMWRRESKRSLFKYEYGIQLVSNVSKQNLKSQTATKKKDIKKHASKSFVRTMKHDSNKRRSKATLKDISTSGVFIATEEKLEVGQLLKLNLPNKKGKREEIIGQIAWVDDKGFGLKFKTK